MPFYPHPFFQGAQVGVHHFPLSWFHGASTDAYETTQFPPHFTLIGFVVTLPGFLNLCLKHTMLFGSASRATCCACRKLLIQSPAFPGKSNLWKTLESPSNTELGGGAATSLRSQALAEPDCPLSPLFRPWPTWSSIPYRSWAFGPSGLHLWHP